MRLIDADAAIEAFGLSEKTRKYGGDHSGYDTMMLYEIQDILDDLPTIEQPTPTDWIKMSDADGEYYCCNNCGEDLQRYQLDAPTFDKPFPPKISIERTRFCPNCGARMVTE